MSVAGPMAATDPQQGGGDGHSSLSRQASGLQTPTQHASGKLLKYRIELLDGSSVVYQISPKARGETLFGQVCEQLSLLENDYFGLEYSDSLGNKYWLDLEKPIGRQLATVAPSSNAYNLHFCVKFYTPDPVQLEEEITRYLFVLQIRKDLASGLMPCQDTTAALLAAYVVQAEEGDYSPDNYRDYTYLLKYKFLPTQDVMFLSQVRDSHLQLVGQSPAEADLNFLETARRCEMYGMKMHAANDHEGVALNLAVAHMGIVVFQNLAKINTFSWAKIRKLSFKRKRFLIKLHPEGFGYYKDTVEFYFDSRNSCKNFWKKCIEHHGFFRCPIGNSLPRSKTKIFPSGSSFRFSGRTQKQVLEFARDNYGKRPSFQRSSGSSRIRSSQSCGASLAATPLLPMARARESRYNTTGGTRSRKMQQGENGALARSRSEPMEVTNPDRSSDSGSRTLERSQRVDGHQEMPVSSQEYLPDEHFSHSSITRTERYDDYRTTNGHHVVQEVAVTVEGEVPVARRISRESVHGHEDSSSPPTVIAAVPHALAVAQSTTVHPVEQQPPPIEEIEVEDALARVDSLTGVDIDKDIPYVLYRRHIHWDKPSNVAGSSRSGHKEHLVKTSMTREQDGKMVYYMETQKIQPESPQLFASSKRVPTPPNKFRILDYVNRKNLPPEGNYSYEDDSASVDSMERELFEALKQKYLLRMRQIREKSQSQESISSNDSDAGSSTSADSYDTVSLEELTNMRNLSQIFDQVYPSGNESAAFSSTTSINTVNSIRSMPQWDPQTEAEIQQMAGVIATAFGQREDEDTVIEPPNGFGDIKPLKPKHRRESYELAIRDGRGRPSLTESELSHPPPVPPKPPKLAVLQKFAEYSQSMRDSFELSDMDLRVFDERCYGDIQQTIRETCSVGMDRVTSSENMSSTSDEPLDVPEISVKKIRQLIRTCNVQTETSSTSSNDTVGNEGPSIAIQDLPSPSQLFAVPIDIDDITEIPEIPEEFRDIPPVYVEPVASEPAEYQAWKAQMKELEQLTGAKSSNEPSPVTPSGTGSSRTVQAQSSTSSGGGGFSRGFTRRTPIGSTWLYRATSSDPDWEDSETSASDTQATTSRERRRSKTPPKSN